MSEIIFCSDIWIDIKILFDYLRYKNKFNRLLNLFNLNYFPWESFIKNLENHMFFSRLLIIKLFDNITIKNKLINFINFTSIKYNFKKIFFIEKTNLSNESYILSDVNKIDILILWNYFKFGRIVNLDNFFIYLNKLLINNFSFKNNLNVLKFKLSNLWIPNFGNVKPVYFTKYKKTLIYFYDTDIKISSNLLLKIINMCIFYRIQILPLYIQSFNYYECVLLYKKILKDYLPLIIISLIYFNNKNFFFPKVTILQIIQSELLVNLIFKNKLGVSKIDLNIKVSLTETEGKIFIRNVSYVKIKYNNIIKQNYLDKTNILISNRIRFVIKTLVYWINLNLNKKKKFIFILSNYPNLDSRIGNGVGLDTIESIVNIINFLYKSKFRTSLVIKFLLKGCTNFSNLNRFLKLSISISFIKNNIDFSKLILNEINLKWGVIYLDPYIIGKSIVVSILKLNKLTIGIQPSRGYNLNNIDLHHSSHLVTPHYYYVFYLYFKNLIKISLILNIGKHGNLEWLPGRGISLSKNCYPEIIIKNIPNLYLFIINNPGEGTQAKRRTNSVIISHNIPPIVIFNFNIEINFLKKKIDLYRLNVTLNKNISITNNIYINLSDKYLCNFNNLKIRTGLYIIGSLEFINAINNSILISNIYIKYINLFFFINWKNFNYRLNTENLILVFFLRKMILSKSIKFYINKIKRIILLNIASIYSEIKAIIIGMKNKFIFPSLSNSFSRNNLNILPTGRNFYSLNYTYIPTPFSYIIGKESSRKIIKKYYRDNCNWLKNIGINVWGTSNMRTGGDDISQIMSFMGVKPIWSKLFYKIIGFEILPLNLIKHPRINILIRISGFFRDSFLFQLDYIFKIIKILNRINEKNMNNISYEYYNYIKKFNKLKNFYLIYKNSLKKIFCSKPGTYGVGIQELIDNKNWRYNFELAKNYLSWGNYSYNDNHNWSSSYKNFKSNLKKIQLIIHNQDNYEHDILNSDDYYQFEGGMKIASRYLGNDKLINYHIDTSNSFNFDIKVRKLKYEIDRILKCRLINNNWIKNVLKYKFKGVSEIISNIDYLFAYSVTTNEVNNYQFESIYNIYIKNGIISKKLIEFNINGFKDLKHKLLEAISRGIWYPIANSTKYILNEK